MTRGVLIMHHSSRFRILLLSPFLLSACVQGQGVAPTQGLRVSTTPAGATAVSSYGDQCTTPCTIFLPTDKGGDVTVSKTGYETTTVNIGTKFDKAGAALEAPDLADPASTAVSAVFLAAFGKGMYKNLERNRLDLVLEPVASPETGGEAAAVN
jgi:hypothetical protein